MGGNTEVDLSALRAVADQVTEAADAIAEIHWPAMPVDELKGSIDGQLCLRPTSSPPSSPTSSRTCAAGRSRRAWPPTRSSAPTAAAPTASLADDPADRRAGQAWKPDALRKTADDWDAAATDLRARVDAVVRAIDGSRDFWTGSAADAARGHGGTIAASGALGDAVPDHRRRRGARRRRPDGLGARRGAGLVAAARTDGFAVADDGVVTGGGSSPLLVSLAGGSAEVAADVLDAPGSWLRSTGSGPPTPTPRSDITEALNPPHAPKARDSTRRCVAGAAGRRRRGLVGDRPGPDRRTRSRR